MQKLLRKGVKGWRKLAGTDTAFERRFKATYRKAVVDRVRKKTGPDFVQYTGPNFAVIRSKNDPDARRVGVLLRGGCDLPSTFTAAPLIGPGLEGTVGIFKQGTGGELGAHRTDQMLQTLGDAATADTAEVRRRLRLEEH